jgi:exodeoxyribonuclease VII small subunit
MKKQFDFAKAMKELEEINQWFQEEDIDLDTGLEKLKRGKELITACRERLKDVENQFIQIRDDSKAAPSTADVEITETIEKKVVIDTKDEDEDEDDLPF